MNNAFNEEIYKDHNGVVVGAQKKLFDGENVHGHCYWVSWFDNEGEEGFRDIDFQRGPVKENGVNGVTNEALLAIIAHRLKYLDSRLPSPNNKLAYEHIKQALEALENRTADRLVRGVEGTEQE